jgi:hypothetical protein
MGDEEGCGDEGRSCSRYPCAMRITAPLRSENTTTCWGRVLVWVGGSGCGEEEGLEKKRDGGDVVERIVGEVDLSEGDERGVGVVGGGVEAGSGIVNCEVKEKVLPLPSSLCTQIRPPKAATICREIARPSPVPPCFRVALK